jgi:hypothetical protein
MTTSRIRTRERDTIIQALRAGVVPKVGLQHIQVGRARETEELVRDIERTGEGGSAIRFVIGEYGSGKTFFLNLVRLVAMEKGLVVLSADITPDRRLHGTGGQARSLYAELARNTSTRTRPDGGAMAPVVERFATQAIREAEKNGQQTGDVIRDKLAHLQEMTGGYDFATVIARYWEGFDNGNEDLKTAALRWLRGEYATRTDARRDLGVRTIVDDASVYDQLKLLALFVQGAGYRGLLVSLDEMVNLYKIVNTQARQSNYEQLLRILNDVLQGTARNLGFIMGGTPEFLMDTRRGLYSYQALQSRLAENAFARDGMVDLSGPVVRLANLTPEDMFVLLANIRRVMQDDENAVPDEALAAFMAHCSDRIGDAYFRTPRNTVKEFVNLLSVLDQNPGTQWQSLIGSVDPEEDIGPEANPVTEDGEEDDLASFKL